MSVMMIVATLMSGAIVGALLGLFGGGRSVFTTPLLLYVVGIRDPTGRSQACSYLAASAGGSLASAVEDCWPRAPC